MACFNEWMNSPFHNGSDRILFLTAMMIKGNISKFLQTVISRKNIPAMSGGFPELSVQMGMIPSVESQTVPVKTVK